MCHKPQLEVRPDQRIIAPPAMSSPQAISSLLTEHVPEICNAQLNQSIAERFSIVADWKSGEYVIMPIGMVVNCLSRIG